MLSYNIVNNSPFTPRYIKNANKIFGPNLPPTKEKSVSSRLESVVINYAEIPEEILSMNTGMEVSVDVMLVNTLALLESVRKWMKFKTIK